MEKVLSRKNIYLTALFLSLILVICYALKVQWRDNIEILFFNPIWPIILFLLDVYLKNRDEKVINDYDRKFGAIGSSVNTAKNMGDGVNMPIKSILDATSGEDLLQKERDSLKEKELVKKTKQAGEVDKSKEINLKV